jgi:hypothetical protein
MQYSDQRSGEMSDELRPNLPPETEFFGTAPGVEAVAIFAKQRALEAFPLSPVAMWARAVRVGTSIWAIGPVAVAGALAWAGSGHTPKIDRLAALAIGALAVLWGVNLLRGAARDLSAGVVAGTTLRTSDTARAGLGLLFFGLLVGIASAHWLGGGGVALGIIGLALAVGYGLLPSIAAAIPAEELVPAALAGPLLTVLVLMAQPVIHQTTIPGHGKVPAQVITSTTNALSGSGVAVGCGLGLLLLVWLLASRLAAEPSTGGYSTISITGKGGMRAAMLASLALAYVSVILAGVRHGAPHATAAVLLSLPAAVGPLTGIVVASGRGAMGVLAAQALRLAWWFCGCLVGGLMLAVVYSHVLMILHHFSH